MTLPSISKRTRQNRVVVQVFVGGPCTPELKVAIHIFASLSLLGRCRIPAFPLHSSRSHGLRMKTIMSSSVLSDRSQRSTSMKAHGLRTVRLFFASGSGASCPDSESSSVCDSSWLSSPCFSLSSSSDSVRSKRGASEPYNSCHCTAHYKLYTPASLHSLNLRLWFWPGIRQSLGVEPVTEMPPAARPCQPLQLRLSAT